MRRADRLFEIIQALRGGRMLTAQRLADRLEVSKRTIYRDMVHLQACGVPIEGEAGVGYLLSSDYHMPPLTFTRDELAALILGARMTMAWAGKGLAAAAEEALVKIETAIPDDQKQFFGETQLFALSFGHYQEDSGRLDDLRKLCDDRRFLDLRYDSLKEVQTSRLVRPLGLYFWGRVWTLLTWCELRQDFRSFRVDRIIAMEASTEHFPRERGKELQDFIDRMTCNPD